MWGMHVHRCVYTCRKKEGGDRAKETKHLHLPLKIVLNKKWNDFLSFSFPASFFTFTSTSPTSCT